MEVGSGTWPPPAVIFNMIGTETITVSPFLRTVGFPVTTNLEPASHSNNLHRFGWLQRVQGYDRPFLSGYF